MIDSEGHCQVVSEAPFPRSFRSSAASSFKTCLCRQHGPRTNDKHISAAPLYNSADREIRGVSKNALCGLGRLLPRLRLAPNLNPSPTFKGAIDLTRECVRAVLPLNNAHGRRALALANSTERSLAATRSIYGFIRALECAEVKLTFRDKTKIV
jgi:hypothetical protein